MPESEWRVREALCHLAARSNSVPLVEAAVERARAFTGNGDMSVADLLMAAGPGHDDMHLDQIESAIRGHD